MIDLHKLQHFTVLARTGSFVRAAERLHLSQPALSRSIQALERHHGVTLFDRSRSGVFLTAVGKQLLVHAEDLIFNAKSLEQSLAGASAGISGTVTFGIGPNAGTIILPELLRTLIEDYPEIRVRAVPGSARTLMRRLLDTEIEFLVGARDPQCVSEHVRIETLWHTTPAFLVRKGHPLLAMDAVPLEALQSYPRLAPAAWKENLVHVVPEEARDWLRPTIELDNFELLRTLAMSTDAILVATRGHETESLEHLRISTARHTLNATAVELFTRKGRTLSPASRSVLSILKDITDRAGSFT
jgi:DNA-binding transcriptional LysR family regulator